ncbi:helix-turn-helix transcriptional regulator [Arsenophonus sp. PmNCSU2021_1]|uniref:helix-turn-helix transcriptional regulator n=1 Tax=Arsenophonus sp. PmNCSU2021_1 TaxID=3118989 RepID=UPI002FEFBEF4
MKTSDVLTKHLISFMERQQDFWCIADTESRFIHANKAAFIISLLPMNLDIEGKLICECPVSWCEYGDIVHFHQQIVLKSGNTLFYVINHITGKKRLPQPFFVKKSVYYNHSKIAGTISHGRKIPPRLLSEHFFKNPNTPYFLTNHPPNNIFTTEELNVLFFAMKLMSNQEIALRLGTYCCVVEQIIQQIYKKIDIYTRKQLRDYGIAERFDNYFPPFLLKGLL